MLPSKILQEGSTLDIYIMDVALSYQEYRKKLEKGQYAESYEQQDLMSMMSKVKNKNG